MSKARMEAFSDGVIAIIITIMVLELQAPDEVDVTALLPLVPVFLSYLLSFVFLGIYWNNHHHLLQVVKQVNGPVLWANLHLLFWLSLIPFVTSWMGANPLATWPAALYGIVLFLAGVAYFILVRVLISINGRDSVLAIAIGGDFKGKISPVIYLVAVALSLVSPWLAYALYVLVAVMWLVPDRRIEKILTQSKSTI
jgi:uncharacterized membrane protein